MAELMLVTDMNKLYIKSEFTTKFTLMITAIVMADEDQVEAVRQIANDRPARPADPPCPPDHAEAFHLPDPEMWLDDDQIAGILGGNRGWPGLRIGEIVARVLGPENLARYSARGHGHDPISKPLLNNLYGLISISIHTESAVTLATPILKCYGPWEYKKFGLEKASKEMYKQLKRSQSLEIIPSSLK